MKPILVVLAVLWPSLLYCQQNKELISTSGYQESSNYVLSASLGQSFVQQTTNDFYLSEGFQQYFENEEYVQSISSSDLIYPNPATSFVTLQSISDIKNLRVFNDIGALIKTFKNIYQTEYRLQLNALKPGIYLFEMEYSDGTKSVKKIVKI